MVRFLILGFGLAWVQLPLLAQPMDKQEVKLVPEKEAHKPTILADRIILTWKGNPATSQAVTWRTSTEVKKAYAEIALAEEAAGFANYYGRSKKDEAPTATKITRLDATTEVLESDLSTAHYHSVHFDNLKPNMIYLYRVGDGANWSEWFQFRTASDKPEPFSFVYFGDAQNDVKAHWSRVIRQSYSDAPKARFFLHAGDLINVANRDAEWGEWFGAGGWLNGTIPSFPSPGNHEYAAVPAIKKEEGKKEEAKKEEGRKSRISKHWRPQFTLPEHGPAGLEESVYYMDYQGVRFISLNSNERIEEQAVWLKGVLEKNPNRWTIVTYHHPFYAASSNRKIDINQKQRDAWQPLFDQFHVDLALQGHDHAYGRSGQILGKNVPTGLQTRDPQFGTVYVVSVSGPKMYPQEKRDWMLKQAAQKQLYQVIHIDGETLKYESRTATGELFDRFELRKQADGKNKLVEIDVLEAEEKKEKVTWNQNLLVIGTMVGFTILYFLYRTVTRTGW